MTELPSAFAWATVYQGSTLSDMLALMSHKAERAHSFWLKAAVVSPLASRAVDTFEHLTYTWLFFLFKKVLAVFSKTLVCAFLLPKMYHYIIHKHLQHSK